MDRVILHIDINNFYASVAIKNNPVLKGKPLIICGDIEKRHGIVLAKSTEAKKMGIKTAETIGEAKKKCPNLILHPADYKQYTRISAQAFEIYKSYTPLVESFGLDECWLDITGCQKLHGSGEKVAEEIRERIKQELGITVSIGVSFTKVFAKLGSDYKKPDAVTIINKDNYKSIVWNLPVKELLYVGSAVSESLARAGINTIGELANTDLKYLVSRFGKIGEKMHSAANGTEDEEIAQYNTSSFPKSISNGTTPSIDIADEKRAKALIFSLSEMIAFRLRRRTLRAGGVTLSLRYSDFKTASRQAKLNFHTDDAIIIAEEVLLLLKGMHAFKTDGPLRSITVGTYSLAIIGDSVQASFFDDNQSKNVAINTKIDKIRKKYGYNTIKRAIEISSGYGREDMTSDGYIPFSAENGGDIESFTEY